MKKIILTSICYLFILKNFAQTNKECGCLPPKSSNKGVSVYIELVGDPCSWKGNKNSKNYNFMKAYAAFECCMKRCKEKKKKEAIRKDLLKQKRLKQKKIQKQNELYNKNLRLKQKEANEIKKLNSLNLELEKATQNAKKLHNINIKAKKTFKDFKPKSQLDDSFLTNSQNDIKKNNNLDFLTSEVELKKQKEINSKWKVDSKNGMYGVINPITKKILIPYKKWYIQKYQDGIAKVYTVLENEKVCSTSLGNYYASVKKVGFVDSSGSYLDKPEITIEGDFDYQAKLILAGPNYDRIKATLRRKKAKQECIKKGKLWKINAKKRYL